MSVETSLTEAQIRSQSSMSSSAEKASVPVDKPESTSRVVEESARIEAVEDVSVEVAEKSFSINRLREMVKELEEALPPSSKALNFRVDEVLNRPVITVIDKANGEIIRELPPREVLRAVHNIDRMRGILFDSNS